MFQKIKPRVFKKGETTIIITKSGFSFGKKIVEDIINSNNKIEFLVDYETNQIGIKPIDSDESYSTNLSKYTSQFSNRKLSKLIPNGEYNAIKKEGIWVFSVDYINK